MTDGVIAFDYHGYSARERLLGHHRKSAGWNCTIEKVDYDLLDTAELNQRQMLGPDQYLYDPVPRPIGSLNA